MQQCFVEMYADLCARLHADMKKANIEADFKRSLLDRCQQSFNAHLEPPGIDECLDYEEQYEMLVKYKTRMTGTVRLIGHLLRQRMLSPKFIFVCAEELLEIGSPEALETLCAFLETIGSTFDAQEWQGRARLEEVFVRARRYSEDPERPQRSRCLLKDLLDLRQRQWKARVIKEPEVAAPPQRAPEGQRAAQDDSNWRAPRDPARAEEPRAHPSPQGGRASIAAARTRRACAAAAPAHRRPSRRRAPGPRRGSGAAAPGARRRRRAARYRAAPQAPRTRRRPVAPGRGGAGAPVRPAPPRPRPRRRRAGGRARHWRPSDRFPAAQPRVTGRAAAHAFLFPRRGVLPEEVQPQRQVEEEGEVRR
ncbi:unnamed protein product [Prorocentrum cordatum]|uniref:MIF4G domain-containing protein n=1 Tax=Prorocentrum cordatum TaxID=2364126 RepID=A0ABN9UPT0_9DINO|nr:unnamed protein product [Polarella glacialis]